MPIAAPTTTPAQTAPDQTRLRNQFMFPLEDADKAFTNALQDSGYNPYRANPFVESLKRASRGLRQSYIQANATSPNNTQFHDPNAQYADYLKNNIQGGSIYKTLNEAYGQMPNAISAVRQNQQDLAAGRTTADQANPYLQLLQDELSANEGQGTANALTFLRAPVMGTQLGKAYSGMLGDVVSSSNRTLANDPAAFQPGSNRDIWSYIFGSSGSPF